MRQSFLFPAYRYAGRKFRCPFHHKWLRKSSVIGRERRRSSVAHLSTYKVTEKNGADKPCRCCQIPECYAGTASNNFYFTVRHIFRCIVQIQLKTTHRRNKICSIGSKNECLCLGTICIFVRLASKKKAATGAYALPVAAAESRATEIATPSGQDGCIIHPIVRLRVHRFCL